MNEAVALYNANGYFPKTLWADYDASVPTAQASYSGWIDFGGQISTRTALHEISHTLGVGQVSAWNTNRSGNTWTGTFAINRVKLFDGPAATLSADAQHFWPYGLNQSSEDGTTNRVRHVKMVAAMRRDMGIVTDSDGDGIPNDWEMFHFGNLSQAATGDADGDGINNLAEYNADTHPAAATYQWTGNSNSDWPTTGNWSTAPGPRNGTYYARINVNNGINSPLIHNASHGNTTYRPDDRGLVIGSGSLGGGSMILTGGTLSTVGAASPDVIGNSGNTGTLTLDGGSFTSTELHLGVSGQGTGILNLNQGTANISVLAFRFATGGSGTVNLNAATLTTSGISRTGSGSATLNLNGGTLRAAASSTTFLENLTSAFIRSGGVNIDTAAFNITIPQILRQDPASPNGGLTKMGAGILTLTQANTYSGPTAVNAGILIPENADAISNTISVAADATLALTGSSTHPIARTLSISGTGEKITSTFTPAAQRGALQSISGNNTWNGPLSIAATNTRIGVQDGASLTLNGSINEANSATNVIFRAGLNAGDDITLNTPATWTGDTIAFSSSATGGALRLGASHVLPSASPLLLAGNSVAGRVDMNGFNQTVAGLTNSTGGSSAIGTGVITNNGSAPSTLTLSPATTRTFIGTIRDGIQPIHLVKSGPATQILTASQAYTGNTSVTAGTLRLDQITLADASSVSISTGAKLHLNFAGADTIATLTLGGTLQPPGTYTAATHPSYLSGTGSLSVPTNFTNWLNLFPSLSEADRSPTADPDRDHLPNLAEYALGTAANTFQTNAFTYLRGHPSHGLSFHRLPTRTDVTLTVEAGTTLSDWTPIARSTAGAPFISLLEGVQCVESALDASRIQATITDVSGQTNARFLRISITR